MYRGIDNFNRDDDVWTMNIQQLGKWVDEWLAKLGLLYAVAMMLIGEVVLFIVIFTSHEWLDVLLVIPAVMVMSGSLLLVIALLIAVWRQ